MAQELLLFLLIGIFGSVHCVGFCGPILMTLQIRCPQNDLWARFLFTCQYNGGRIFTYTLLGAMAGIFGVGVIHTHSLVWVPGVVMLLAGLFMIYVGLASLYILPGIGMLEGEVLLNIPSVKRFFIKIQGIARWGTFFEGMLMGLIPCGMIYSVLGRSLSSGNPLKGGLYMLVFGLGTLAAMFVICIKNKELRNHRIVDIAYVMLVLTGIVMVIQGLNPLSQHFHWSLDDSPLDLVKWGLGHTFHVANLVQFLYGLGLVGGVVGVALIVRELQDKSEPTSGHSGYALPPPKEKPVEVRPYVVINEEVCEGCGDCVSKSNCLDLKWVETTYGEKVRVDYPSCSRTFACLEAFCPSFLLVEPSADVVPRPKRKGLPELEHLPEPALKVSLDNEKEEYKVIVVGMDSSDVATVVDLLSTAAELDGIAGLDLGAYALNFTEEEANIATWIFSEYMVDDPDCYGADLLVGLDLGATAAVTRRDDLSPARTVAIVNTALVSTSTSGPEREGNGDGQGEIEHVNVLTKAEGNIFVNVGELGDRLLGNRQLSPFVLLGIAYQAGLLPVRAGSLEEAIQQSRAGKEETTAFKVGRYFHLHREELAQAIEADQWSHTAPTDLALEKLTGQGVSAVKDCEQILADHAVEDDALQLVLYPRVADLILYQDSRYARQYAGFVLKTMRREQEKVAGRLGLTLAVARYLFKLMAYKDEYEVARLYLLEANRQRLASLFGDLSLCKVSYRLRLPWKKAITIVDGRWMEPAFRVLAAGKWMRRHAWYPFLGSTSIRRSERNLLSWYQQVIEDLLLGLHEGNYALALSIAMAPEKIRGYGHIKEASMADVRAAVERSLLLYKSRTKEGVMTPEDIAGLGVVGSKASSNASTKTIQMFQQG
jgi:sulfite exporter TauE/SafE